MASKQVVEAAGSAVVRQVKPIYSTTPQEAHRRVLRTYKLWMKHMPALIHYYKLPYTDSEIKYALKAQYLKNAHVRDVRIIDRLAHEAEIEYISVKESWTPTYTMQNVLWGEHLEPKPKDFLSKFFAGKD